jgi:hypothetical protein
LVLFIVRKGFQELAKGLKESLDEAYSVIHLSRVVGKAADISEVLRQKEDLAKRANRAHVPTILEWVNSELGLPPEHTAMVRNVQKVRSCLEHRDGVVGAMDVNNVSRDALELAVPTLKIIAVGDETGKKTEVLPGVTLEEGSRVAPTFIDEHLSFPLGTRIEINPERFNHIALSNWVFASDLVKRVEALLRAEGNIDFD